MNERALTALCLALTALVCLAGIGVHPLHEPDETRYAEIAREVAVTGDWVTLRLDEIRYFEKPPLYFHLAALAMKALGPTEAAARLPSAIAALVTAAIVLAIGRRAFGPRTGALAALLATTAPLAGVFSRVAIVDGVLTACTSAALAGVYLAGPAGRARKGALVFWGAAGLALLAKGPVGLALPGVAAAAYAAAARDMGLVRALAWPGGPALALAIAAPWAIAMERANPGWLRAFLLEQNVGRLVQGERFGRNVSWWFYVALLPAAFLPWTLLLPRAALRARESFGRVRARAAEANESDRARVFLVAATLAPLALLSAAQSQLAYYVLPLLPPLALLAADAAAREAERRPPPPGPEEPSAGRVGRGFPPPGQEPSAEPPPAPPSALSLGDASSAVSRPTAQSIRLAGPVQPPRPLATAFLGLALLLAAAAAACAFAALAPDVAREAAAARVPPDIDRAPLFQAKLDAIVPLAGHAAVVLALLAVGAALSGIAESRGLRERAPLPLAAALAIALAGLPWVLARAAPAYSSKPLADALAAHVGPEDEILHYGHFFRGVVFYLRRPSWLWAAGYTEFGRNTSPDEIAARDLDGSKERLEVAWRGERRWVAICGGERDLVELRGIVGERRVEVIARVHGRIIVQSRPRK